MNLRRRLRLVAAESVTRSTAVHIVQESVWTGGQDSAKVAETLTFKFLSGSVSPRHRWRRRGEMLAVP